MHHSVRIRVWGEHACFTRPENKAERVSYDAMTPSAARGVLEAIYWKPAIRWNVDRIHVLKPIQFTNLRRNEVGCKASASLAAQAMKAGRGELGIYIEAERQQRAATVLRNVEYLVEAHFELLRDDDPPQKHFEMFKRRAEKGQCFYRPYLGTREFNCEFEWHEGDSPTGAYADVDQRDLGFMLHDIDFTDDMAPRFFHAVMRRGVIDVPPWDASEVRR